MTFSLRLFRSAKNFRPHTSHKRANATNISLKYEKFNVQKMRCHFVESKNLELCILNWLKIIALAWNWEWSANNLASKHCVEFQFSPKSSETDISMLNLNVLGYKLYDLYMFRGNRSYSLRYLRKCDKMECQLQKCFKKIHRVQHTFSDAFLDSDFDSDLYESNKLTKQNKLSRRNLVHSN